MKLKNLMEQLRGYNQEAEVSVVVDNQSENFSLAFGNSEGVTKETCETISFYVDGLNDDEQERCGKFKIPEEAFKTDIISAEGRKLRGTWTSYITPSLWHWSIYIGYFKIKWWHYLLRPWFPTRD